MKHISTLVAVIGLVVVAGAQRAEAQAVNANIQTTCTMDATAAAIPVGAWLLSTASNPNALNGASVNINNCNTTGRSARWTARPRAT